jgi:DNA-binding GntR family transcriptional regulator
MQSDFLRPLDGGGDDFMTKGTLIDRRISVPRQVYEVLRNRILSAELAPGESINERGLSEWLGVSRTPIREAIHRLAAEGLVQILPNVGTSVTFIDPKRISECCVVRTSLECVAIARAVCQFDDVADRKLTRLIEDQQETIATGDMLRNIAVDNEFHGVIISLSGYSMVEEFLQKVTTDIIRMRHLSIKLPGRLHGPIKEHRAILMALRSSHERKAVAAMRSHLTASYASIIRAMETGTGKG